MTVLKKKIAARLWFVSGFPEYLILYICIFHKFYKIKSFFISFRFLLFWTFVDIDVEFQDWNSKKWNRSFRSELFYLILLFFILFFILIWFYRLKISTWNKMKSMKSVLFYGIVRKIVCMQRFDIFWKLLILIWFWWLNQS